MRWSASADHVELVSTFRSFDADGDLAAPGGAARPGRGARAALGGAVARRVRAHLRPDLWFTYHVYYKAPDWLGPAVSEALGIPYVIAEASHAEKRAAGPWALGHAAAADAIRRARLILEPSRDDVAGLQGAGGVGPHRAPAAVPRRDAVRGGDQGARARTASAWRASTRSTRRCRGSWSRR